MHQVKIKYIIKIIFLLFKMATRKILIEYVAHIFLPDSAKKYIPRIYQKYKKFAIKSVIIIKSTAESEVLIHKKISKKTPRISS